jgi:hypothetical protein
MRNPKRKPEISPEIVWPVLAYDESDPEFRIDAEDEFDLGRNIEFWNSDDHPDDNSLVMFDAKGRELGGEIDLLEVVKLYIKDPPGKTPAPPPARPAAENERSGCAPSFLILFCVGIQVARFELNELFSANRSVPYHQDHQR